jgi:hypothetical protein
MRKILYKLKKSLLNKFIEKKLPEWYFHDFDLIVRQKGQDKTFEKINQWPIVDEKYAEAGEAKGHYFHQDLYVAQKVYENKAIKHVDIGSRIDGFVAHVASYRKIELFDIRPSI